MDIADSDGLSAAAGASYKSPKMQNLKRAFFQVGFHVVCLTSPTIGNFIVTASSSGMPGDLENDAADLYRVMARIWDNIRKRVDRQSLARIEPYLAKTEKIGMFHNVADVILESGELQHLIRIFGPRTTIYPAGGHCGNMDHRQIVTDMIRWKVSTAGCTASTSASTSTWSCLSWGRRICATPGRVPLLRGRFPFQVRTGPDDLHQVPKVGNRKIAAIGTADRQKFSKRSDVVVKKARILGKGPLDRLPQFITPTKEVTTCVS